MLSYRIKMHKLIAMFLSFVLLVTFIPMLQPSSKAADTFGLDSWTARNSGTTNSLRDVTYGGGTFVAVGSNGTIQTSDDGTSWTASSSGTDRILAELLMVMGLLSLWVVGKQY